MLEQDEIRQELRKIGACEYLENCLLAGTTDICYSPDHRIICGIYQDRQDLIMEQERGRRFIESRRGF